jgi:hypothetical protein
MSDQILFAECLFDPRLILLNLIGYKFETVLDYFMNSDIRSL